MRSAAAIAARALLTLAAISFVAFLIIKAIPGDPAVIALRGWNVSPTPELVAGLHAAWGLDDPLVVQYARWLGRYLTGDWGVSFRTGEPVLREFLARLPLSVGLGVGGLAIAALVAMPIGFGAARRRGGVTDWASRLLSVMVQSVPVFLLGLVLLWLLGVKLRLIVPFAADLPNLLLPLALIAL